MGVQGSGALAPPQASAGGQLRARADSDRAHGPLPSLKFTGSGGGMRCRSSPQYSSSGTRPATAAALLTSTPFTRNRCLQREGQRAGSVAGPVRSAWPAPRVVARTGRRRSAHQPPAGCCNTRTGRRHVSCTAAMLPAVRCPHAPASGGGGEGADREHAAGRAGHHYQMQVVLAGRTKRGRVGGTGVRGREDRGQAWVGTQLALEGGGRLAAVRRQGGRALATTPKRSHAAPRTQQRGGPPRPRTCVPNRPRMCGSSNCLSQAQPPLQAASPLPTA